MEMINIFGNYNATNSNTIITPRPTQPTSAWNDDVITDFSIWLQAKVNMGKVVSLSIDQECWDIPDVNISMFQDVLRNELANKMGGPLVEAW